MVRVISVRHSTPAGFKLTELFGIYDFSVAKESGKVLIIIIDCFYNYYYYYYYCIININFILIIVIIIIIIIIIITRKSATVT